MNCVFLSYDLLGEMLLLTVQILLYEEFGKENMKNDETLSYFCLLSMTPWAVTNPYTMAAYPEFHIGCRLGRELYNLHLCCCRCP